MMAFGFVQVLTISLVVIIHTTWAQCPSGFEQIYYNSNCYRINYNTLSWDLAGNSCQHQFYGSHLVIVETQEESDALYNLLDGKVLTFVWTDGTQVNGIDPWIWSTTGEPFNFTAWIPGQPDNYMGNENCMDFWFNNVGASTDGYWNDDACGESNYYLCEYER